MITGLVLALTCPAFLELRAIEQREAAQRLVDGIPEPAAFVVLGAGVEQPYGVASGEADPVSGRPLSPETPVRIASNTKTFVAATLLRMYERGEIDLDASIVELADPDHLAILRRDGYRVENITIRHLLSHSAGIYDQGSDPRFIPAVLANPARRWSRAELLALATEYGDPLSEPGSAYAYSDAGYILLGGIVERQSGLPLAAAVRLLLDFEKIGLASAWWESIERPPAEAEPRARQFLRGVDGTDVDPSYDLYGGGGLVMSARDLATFMAALMEGRVFDRPETLALMLEAGPHQGSDRYRMGLQAKVYDGVTIYYHSGFWGTGVYYNPVNRRAAAGVTTEQLAFRQDVVPVIETMLGLTPSDGSCREPPAG